MRHDHVANDRRIVPAAAEVPYGVIIQRPEPDQRVACGGTVKEKRENDGRCGARRSGAEWSRAES